MRELIGRYVLSASDAKGIIEVVNDVYGQLEAIPVQDAIFKARVFSRYLPFSVVERLTAFDLNESPDVFIVSGIQIERFKLGPTPTSIEARMPEYAFKFDFIHLMFAAILGEVFTFSTIQHGNIINDVIPVKDDAALAISSGFASDFGLHTEDAFSPYSGEYLGLLCVRNPTSASTIIASIRDVDVSEREKSILFQRRFQIKHNIAHHRSSSDDAMLAIMSGSVSEPYIRVNANYGAAPPDDIEAAETYQILIDKLNSVARDVILSAGDFMYINNRVVAHGRRKYEPIWTGEDRWLRRLYITKDLKRSRHLRRSATDRVIGEH